MNNEQENKTPVAVRVYRKLRYVLATLVLLIMAAAVAQVVYVLSEYRKGDDMYRAVADSYVLPPRTPRPNQQQNATDGQGQQDQQGQQGEATFRPDESPDPDATPAPDSDATTAPPSEPQEFAPFSVDFHGLQVRAGSVRYDHGHLRPSHEQRRDVHVARKVLREGVLQRTPHRVLSDAERRL